MRRLPVVVLLVFVLLHLYRAADDFLRTASLEFVFSPSHPLPCRDHSPTFKTRQSSHANDRMMESSDLRTFRRMPYPILRVKPNPALPHGAVE